MQAGAPGDPPLAGLDNPQAMLQALFSQTPHSLFVLDTSGRLIEANAVAERLLFRDVPRGGTVLQATWSRSLGLADILRRVAAGEAIALPPQWIEPEGGQQARRVALRTNAFPLSDRLVGMVLQDVTAELQAQDEEAERQRQVSATRARLDAVVQQMPGGVVVAEAPSGRIIFGNTRLERILGHPVIEAEDRSDYRRYGAEHADGRPYAPADHPLARALQGETVEGQEVRYRRPDGEVRILSANAAPILDRAGRIEAAVATFFDRTEEWQAKQSLKLLERAGALLVSSLTAEEMVRQVVSLTVPHLADLCLVYILRDETIHRAHLTHRDPHLEARFRDVWERFERDFPSSHPVRRVILAGQSAFIPEVSDEVLARVAVNEDHLEALQRLPIDSAHIVPLIGRSGVLGALALLMTDDSRAFTSASRRTAEDLGRLAGIALHNAELYRQARRAARLREEVLSVVSHDLRNPVGVVRLSAGLLLRRARDRGDKALEEAARTIEGAAARMRRLIDDLLDLANVDAGRLGLKVTRQPVSALLVEVHAAYRELAARASRQLQLEVAPELQGVELSCDPDRINQAVGNLVDNAVRHAPEGSTVRIRGERSGDEVVFSVHNDGSTIPFEDQAHLFERFWRKEPGKIRSGIGLSIVKAIVQAHGGRVWVESAPDSGTRFLFTVPLPAS